MTSANSTITDQDLKQGLNAIATMSFRTTVNELSEQLEASVDTKPREVTRYFGGPEGGRGEDEEDYATLPMLAIDGAALLDDESFAPLQQDDEDTSKERIAIGNAPDGSIEYMTVDALPDPSTQPQQLPPEAAQRRLAMLQGGHADSEELQHKTEYEQQLPEGESQNVDVEVGRGIAGQYRRAAVLETHLNQGGCQDGPEIYDAPIEEGMRDFQREDLHRGAVPLTRRIATEKQRRGLQAAIDGQDADQARLHATAVLEMQREKATHGNNRVVPVVEFTGGTYDAPLREDQAAQRRRTGRILEEEPRQAPHADMTGRAQEVPVHLGDKDGKRHREPSTTTSGAERHILAVNQHSQQPHPLSAAVQVAPKSQKKRNAALPPRLPPRRAALLAQDGIPVVRNAAQATRIAAMRSSIERYAGSATANALQQRGHGVAQDIITEPSAAVAALETQQRGERKANAQRHRDVARRTSTAVGHRAQLELEQHHPLELQRQQRGVEAAVAQAQQAQYHRPGRPDDRIAVAATDLPLARSQVESYGNSGDARPLIGKAVTQRREAIEFTQAMLTHAQQQQVADALKPHEGDRPLSSGARERRALQDATPAPFLEAMQREAPHYESTLVSAVARDAAASVAGRDRSRANEPSRYAATASTTAPSRDEADRDAASAGLRQTRDITASNILLTAHATSEVEDAHNNARGDGAVWLPTGSSTVRGAMHAQIPVAESQNYRSSAPRDTPARELHGIDLITPMTPTRSNAHTLQHSTGGMFDGAVFDSARASSRGLDDEDMIEMPSSAFREY